MFYVFFKVPNWTEELRSRHEILLECIKVAETLGVRFAFPTQTLHVEEFPGKLSSTPLHKENYLQLKAKLDEYFSGNSSQKSNDPN